MKKDTVWHHPKDGSPPVKVELPSLDAAEAIRLHPDEYSRSEEPRRRMKSNEPAGAQIVAEGEPPPPKAGPARKKRQTRKSAGRTKKTPAPLPTVEPDQSPPSNDD